MTRGARNSVANQGQPLFVTRLIVSEAFRPARDYGTAHKFSLCGNTQSVTLIRCLRELAFHFLMDMGWRLYMHGFDEMSRLIQINGAPDTPKRSPQLPQDAVSELIIPLAVFKPDAER